MKTRIYVDKQSNVWTVEIDGHSAVCSAVSMLGFTLLQTVTDEEEKGNCRILEKIYESGYMFVMVHSKNHTVMDAVFKTVITGFQMLSRDYSQSVTLNTNGITL